MTNADKLVSDKALEKEDKILTNIISANPSPRGGNGKPSPDISGCRVYVGGCSIEHWLAGTLLQFRHLYINVYENPSNYALIEAGPIGQITGGTTGAWIKEMDWDSKGIQWDITPNNCSDFITCLKKKTIEYNAASHPYNYNKGPNSNSFIWWVLNECGVDMSTLISSWPYLGIDY